MRLNLCNLFRSQLIICTLLIGTPSGNDELDSQYDSLASIPLEIKPIPRLETALVSLGKKNGITATEKEIETRKKIYASLYSKNNEEFMNFENCVLEEKTIQSISSYLVSYEQKRILYDSLFGKMSGNNQALTFEEAETHLDYLCRLDNKETIYKVSRALYTFTQELKLNETGTLSDSTQKRIQKETPLYKQFWDPNDLFIKGYDNDCYAFDKSSAECMITVGEFNKALSLIKEPKNTSVDSVYSLVKNKCLDILFLTRKAKESGFDLDPEVNMQILRRIKAYDNSSIAHPELSEDFLRAVYNAEYDKRFAPQEILEFDVIGGTDSIAIDSLYQAVIKDELEKKKRTRSGKIFLQFPFQRLSYVELPPELRKCTDSLRVGDISNLIITRYGFFFIKLVRAENIPEIPFVKARDEIVSLIATGKIGTIREISHNEIQNYYNNNKKNFLTPDTLCLSFALIPSQRSHEIEVLTDSMVTSLIKRKCYAHELPPHLEESINRLYFVNKSVDSFHTVPTPLGELIFCVTTFKQGRKQKPLALVRTEIADILRAAPDVTCILSKTGYAQTLSNEIIATTYAKRLASNIKEPDDDLLKNFEAHLNPEYAMGCRLPDGTLDKATLVKLYKENSSRKELRSFKDRIVWY